LFGQLSEPVQPMAPKAAPGLQIPSESVSTCACEQPSTSTVAPGAVPGQTSQASPTPSPSASVCKALAMAGQLSVPVQPGAGPVLGADGLHTPSPSPSTWAREQPTASTAAVGAVPGHESHALPKVSPSLSICVGFGLVGQLSLPRQLPGPPETAPGLQMPSPSASTWAWEQPLASVAAAGAVAGQRSQVSPALSPSAFA